MKILIVSSYLPYPLLNGGNIRLYNIIKTLQKKHEITLVCEKRESQTGDDTKEVEKICRKVITVKRNKQWSIKNVLKSGFSPMPFLVQGHTSKEFQNAISAELNSGEFDLIHVETFYVMQNVPDSTLPIVLVEHNIEYLVYERFMQKVPFILKPFLAIDINKIKKIEMAFWNQAKIIATVSDQERKIIDKNNCYVVANGVDTKQFAKKTIDKDFAKLSVKTIFL
jgi:glycosyltransferase involved in cell wall biosynthesis